MSKPGFYQFYPLHNRGTLHGLFSSRDYLEVIADYLEHPDTYVRSFCVTINGKRRQITTYQPNRNGTKLREIHRFFAQHLKEGYTSSEHSYAYKTGCNVKTCLEKHLDNEHFLKTDIHAYFDTVSFDRLMEKLRLCKKTFASRHRFWTQILQACFYNGRLPIGFVSSPILSDFYLRDVDERLGQTEGIVYTRYADDFILSATGDGARERLEQALESLQNEMSALGLELNGKKTYFRHLRLEGDAIHVLGLNLVRTAEGGNRLTVSDRYIRQTCRELCDLMRDKSILSDWEARRRFCAAMGKTTYIVQASEDSAEKLKKMILVKSGQQTDLSYHSLAAACMNHPEANAAYQKKRYWLAREKAKGIRLLPTEGRAWERVENPDIYTLGSLKNYVMRLCRAMEGNQGCMVYPNRIRLTVGEETVVIHSPEEAPALYALARKLWETTQPAANQPSGFATALQSLLNRRRCTTKPVSFYADYRYQNPEEPPKKRGRVYAGENAWRPMMASRRQNATCAVFSEAENAWLFGNRTQQQDWHSLTDASPSVLEESSCWKGHVELKAGWPLHTDPALAQQLCSLTEEIRQNLNLPAPEDGERSLRASISWTGSAQSAVLLADQMIRLSSLLLQADGTFRLDGWLLPHDRLDATDERPLDLVALLTDEGKTHILKGTF